MWDPEQCSPTIEIDNRRLLAEQTEDGLGTVIGLPPSPKTSSGKYYFEIKINAIKGGIHIGVASNTSNTLLFESKSKGVGDFPGTWAVDSYSGSFGAEGKWKPYGKKLKTRSIVGFLLDFEKKRIEVYRNGQTFGLFEGVNLVPNIHYFPCVSLKSKGTIVTGNFGYETNIPFVYPIEGALPFSSLSQEYLLKAKDISLVRLRENESGSDLLKFPEEILRNIFSFIPFSEVSKASKICQTFHRISNDNSVWKHRLQTDFPNDARNEALVDHSHRQPYKESYRCHQRWIKSKYDSSFFFTGGRYIHCLQKQGNFLFAANDHVITYYNLRAGVDQLNKHSNHKIELDSKNPYQHYSEDEEEDEDSESESNNNNNNNNSNGFVKRDFLRDREIFHFVGHRGIVNTLQVDVGCHIMVSGGTDKVCRVWDLHNGLCIAELDEHEDEVLTVQFDSQRDDVTPRLHTSSTSPSPSDSEENSHASFLTRQFVSGSRDKTLKVWDLETGSAIHSVTSNHPVFHAYWDSRRTGLIFFDAGKTLKAVDPRVSSHLTMNMLEEKSPIHFAVQPLGPCPLLVLSAGTALEAYDMRYVKPNSSGNMGIVRYKHNCSPFKALKFAGDILVASTQRDVIRGWADPARLLVNPPSMNLVTQIQCFDFDVNGLVTASMNKIKWFDFAAPIRECDWDFRRKMLLDRMNHE